MSRHLAKAVIGLLFCIGCSAPFTPNDPGDGVDASALDDAGTDAGDDATPPDAGGAQISIDLADHGFGDVVVGQQGTTARFTVSNHGDAMSTGLVVATTGSAAGDFTIVSDQCNSQVLAAGAGCAIDVQLAPLTAGPKAAQLRVDGGGAGVVTSDLAGRGLAPGDLEFTDPSAHDYGAIAISSATSPAVFTLHNTGQAALAALAVVLADPAFVIVTDTCAGTTLAAGATCTIGVKFSPATVGPHTGSITVSSSGSTTALPVGGTGTARVTVAKLGAGGGTVTSTPSAITCGPTCDAAFGTTHVTLTAVPFAGSRFLGWSTACSGTSDCALALAADVTLAARFEHQQLLGVTVGGTGSGSVSAIGIACGTDCSELYDYGAQVVLAAIATSGSTFAGWSGGGCAGTSTCSVTMDMARNVTATFTLQQEVLTVMPLGTGAGTIVSSAGGISCPGTCSAGFDYGRVITLTAGASPGSTFAGWGAPCNSTSATCDVTLDAAKTVAATFTLQTYPLTVAKLGNGTGTVASSNVAGINCGADCSETYGYGTVVTLVATPAVGSTFTGWTGGCISSPCSVTIDQARNVSATFSIDLYTVAVSRAGTGTGSVASVPGGIACGTDCTEPYSYNQSVVLTATAAAGSTFTSWSGDCTGTASTCTLTITANRAVTATFAPILYTLAVNRSGTGTGSVTSVPTGIDCGATCSKAYAANTSVTLTPVAASGSRFTGWTGGCSGTGACIVAMTMAQTVTATFDLDPNATLTVIRSGTGTGMVVSDVAGISCGAACAHDFTAGTTVVLTASPATGSTFAGWSGPACTGIGSCTVTITAATTVVATFNVIPETLTVTRTGPGAVTATGIDCGSDCTEIYNYGQVVTLTATVAAGISFVWSGDCAGITTPTCTLAMTSARNVMATFTQITNALTVTTSGTGSGVVSSSPAGITCGAGSTSCSNLYSYGTQVTLSAAPQAGSTFAGWTGACSGVGTCAVTLDAARSVGAIFTLQSYTLTVTRSGAGSGNVAAPGIDCGADCTEGYSYNTQVTLTATAATGSTFVGWSGATCTGTGTCTVTMSAARAVTAAFAPILETITVSSAGTGTGSVTSMPAGIACGSTCSASFDYGTSVVLTATPMASSTFTGWTGACSNTSGPCTILATSAKSVTATFALTTYSLTITKQGTGAGVVTSSPGVINCGGTCTDAFASGATVALTATAATGSTFAGWSGACTNTSGTCSVTMNAGKSVTANFTLNSYTLTLIVSAHGSVFRSPGGVCSASQTCTMSYTYGTVVTLSATPAATYILDTWMGVDAMSGTTASVTINANRTVRATFATGQ